MTEDSNDEVADQLGGLQRRRRPPLMGILRMGLTSAAAIAGGIYLLTRGSHGFGSRAGAILLLAFGAMLALPAVFLVLAFVLRAYFVRKLNKTLGDSSLGDMLEPARNMIERNKQLFAEVQEMRLANEEDFAALDRDWYETATAEVQALGFRHLGDLVNATVERAVGMTIVLRTFVSPDGTTSCALYHVPMSKLPARLQGQKLYTIDFESEFSDGSFALTSNTQEAEQATSPPQIHRTRLPLATPIAELAAAHEKEKATVLAEKPGVNCLTISTLEEGMESQRRQHVIKAAFRKGIGYLDPEEVRRIISLNKPDNEGAVALATATAELARQEELRKLKS